ncbi:hypothetical protein LUZ60_008715 [Juncus effusus]|nr:hypothetical protein LUZ60_008715 [Juncus effusus]
MSTRPAIRPRPLDINKKLPILKSFKEFEDEDIPRSVFKPEPEPETPKAPSKKLNVSEIPTPQFDEVESYERDYSRTFGQPNSYIRSGGARVEVGEFVEYDLDNEDEDWLEEINGERKSLSPEKLEVLLFKLEVLDHRARERAGLIAPTFGAPIPVILQLDYATEALQHLSIRHTVFQSVYSYWKSKRERWQKPILRRLQPPPPLNDTNPYNVFRPREKIQRTHTRRTPRRENNVTSFERLRHVRRNLDQAKSMLEALIKREEKKREAMDCEVDLQRIQITYKNEAQLVEDGMAISGLQVSSRFGSSEDDYADSDDTTAGAPIRRQLAAVPTPRSGLIPPLRIKREQFKRRAVQNGWANDNSAMEPDEPVLLFTRPADPDLLAAIQILQPKPDPSTGDLQSKPKPNPSTGDLQSKPKTEPPTGDLQSKPKQEQSTGDLQSEAKPDPFSGDLQSEIPPFRPRHRMGRGGRIIFDRCNPLLKIDPIGPIGQTISPTLDG